MRGRPSITARHVAAQRAALDRPAGPHGDPDADRRLERSLGRWFGLPRRSGVPMAARTAFFDSQTVAAIGAGVTQVVIVGAGYDGRALRFAHPEVRFFEVDHPATQPDKARRLARVGADTSSIALVPVDLLADNLVAALAERGHDSARPSLFICEGVLAYLPADAIKRLFTSVRQLAAPGSTFATNFFIRPAGAPRRAFLSRTAVDALLRVIGERRMSVFRPGDPERLLAAAGWRVVQDVEGEREGAGHVALVAAHPA